MDSSFDKMMKKPIVPIIIVLLLFTIIALRFALSVDEWTLSDEEPTSTERIYGIVEPETTPTTTLTSRFYRSPIRTL